MIIIIMNAFALSFVWVNIDQNLVNKVGVIQEVFTIVFIIECIMKLVAYYPTLYFSTAWNKFDFLIVVGGLLGTFFKAEMSNFISVIRILRVARVLRLLKKAKSLYQIFNSFLHTIPNFVNVGYLILVMLFIFSTLGSRLFASVKFNGEINSEVNF